MRTNQGRRGTLEADLERGGIGAGLAPLHVKAVDPRGGGRHSSPSPKDPPIRASHGARRRPSVTREAAAVQHWIPWCLAPASAMVGV